MTPKAWQALDRRWQRFLEDLTEPLGRSERRRWARVYVAGLLLDGERQSIEPMAARVAGADVQALRQFVGPSPWEVEEIERRLARKVVDLLSEPEVWIIDETAFPKAGEHSVGVARQYCGTLGKVANCQVAVSLHWSSAEASCPILWRLYLPPPWLEDTARAAEVKLPPGTSYHRKTELALEVIDQAVGWEWPRWPVVADSFYGNDFSFRQALRQRGLTYAVPVEPTTVVWTEDPNRPLPPPKQKGRPRKYPPAAGLGATAGPARPGRAVAALGLANGRLAPRKPGHATLALRPAPGWGGSRLAPTAAPAPRGGVAAGGMAHRIDRADEVLAGATRLAAPRIAALGAHRQGSLASGVGLPRVAGRTGTGSFRGPSMARLAASRRPGEHRLCLSSLGAGTPQKKLLV